MNESEKARLKSMMMGDIAHYAAQYGVVTMQSEIERMGISHENAILNLRKMATILFSLMFDELSKSFEISCLLGSILENTKKNGKLSDNDILKLDEILAIIDEKTSVHSQNELETKIHNIIKDM